MCLRNLFVKAERFFAKKKKIDDKNALT